MKPEIHINASHVNLHIHAADWVGSPLVSGIEQLAEPLSVTAPEAPTSRFNAVGESVTDAVTGLTWSANDVPGGKMTDAEAVTAVGAYRGDGYSNWRLPTRAELLTLVDDTRTDPAIDTTVFPTCKADWYRTSSEWAGSPVGNVWLVHFDSGGANGLGRDDRAFVRAVRSASPGQ
jgi:hypothetical protein